MVHHAAPGRSAAVAGEVMAGHRPAMWLSDRDSAQQGHGERQQACRVHLAGDVALSDHKALRALPPADRVGGLDPGARAARVGAEMGPGTVAGAAPGILSGPGMRSSPIRDTTSGRFEAFFQRPVPGSANSYCQRRARVSHCGCLDRARAEPAVRARLRLSR